MYIASVIRDRVRHEIERELTDLVPLIVEKFHPQKIILFGSAARETAGETSDIDLCVIAETEMAFFDRVNAVLHLYPGKRELQALVYTPEEWQQMIQEGREFIRTIATEGRVLYQAS